MSLRHESEKQQKDSLEALYTSSGLSIFEMFRNFPVFTPRFNLARFLTHYEIFKKVVDLPGAIVDLGVYRGASTFSWAKFCEIFCPTDVKKVVYGFDTFSGFPALTTEDGIEDPFQDRRIGGYHGGEQIEETLRRAQEATRIDKHIRHVDRIEWIKGDVVETIPQFIKDKGEGLRICLLNLDLDLYAPTKTALECFVPRMVHGGIIICDEYAVDTFGGESKAVDEYFKKQFGRLPHIRKFPWHSNPSGYIEVDW
jgi:hypothetical protein